MLGQFAAVCAGAVEDDAGAVVEEDAGVVVDGVDVAA
jgi:hypothetical protein